MNITDEDQLSAREYDEKKKSEKKAYKAKVLKYNERDMLDFGAHILLISTGRGGEDLSNELADWQRSHQ